MNKQLLKREAMMNGDTFHSLAEKIGMPYSTMSAKLNGHRSFRQEEIQAIMDVYKLKSDVVCEIFFT